MNRWQTTRIESVQIAEERDNSRRTTRTFTKSRGVDTTRTYIQDQDVDPKERKIRQYGRAFRPCRQFRSQARRQKVSTLAATTTAKAVKKMSTKDSKKRNFWQGISEQAEALKPDKPKSEKDDSATAAFPVSPERYAIRKWEGKCICCGSPILKTFRCTKYKSAKFPDNLAPPGDGKQIKSHRSFHSQQPKN